MTENRSLKFAVANMAARQPSGDFEYYFITITADESGKPVWKTQTYWVGFEDEERKIELRKARLVIAADIAHTYRELFKQGCFVVDTLVEMRIFLLLGGNGLVEKQLAEKVVPDYFKARPVVRTGHTSFRSKKDVEKTIFNRAPSKKQRMRIIKRDNYRCKICGRSPHNNVDITLHLHHIRSWADKGLTHDENLITLCHTCHEGLDPHNDEDLFGLLKESGKLFDTDSSCEEYLESLRRYREESFRRAREDVSLLDSSKI